MNNKESQSELEQQTDKKNQEIERQSDSHISNDNSEGLTNLEASKLNEGVEKLEDTKTAAYSNVVQEAATPPSTPVAQKSSIGWKISTFVFAIAAAVLLVITLLPDKDAKLATINGEDITKEDLFDTLVTHYSSSVQGILDRLTSEKLLEQELAAKNITLTEADLDAEIAAFRMQYPSDEEFQSFLAYYGMDENSLRNELKMSTQQRLLLQDSITISDEQISEYFETNKASLGAHGEQVRASHILVAEEDLAKQIIDELNNGADFATLAAQYGTDATAQTGGDLGYFEHGQMIPEFSDVAFALEVNEVTQEPVATKHGFHVILKTDYRDAYEPVLDDFKDAIKVELINSEIYNTHSTYLADLESKATIQDHFSEQYLKQEAEATTE